MVPALAVLFGSILQIGSQVHLLDRLQDPVVMLGAALPTLIGQPVDQIVAFRWESGWGQIPVQVDERKVVEYRVVYDNHEVTWTLTTTAYADPTTYTGPDTDPLFDADDELVFMSRDSGGQAPVGATRPAGTVGAGQEVGIFDARDDITAYVYLFATDGSLAPGAGQDYVTYDFNLLAGSYIPNYQTSAGPNPEDSQVVTAHYRTHFSDRWIRDETNVYSGGASGVDILDRHKNLFGPGICGRSENTFCNGEGAFFANKDGPVRAIRSYLGANSGPLTQRDHLFYERRQDIRTFLRVHQIPGIMDMYDYSPDATGMLYFNDLNRSGVIVNGTPDVVTAGPIVWEMVTGAQGSLIMVHFVETNVSPFAHTSYYSDDSTPSVTQCTGDAFEYSTSGVWIDQPIPNTDPLLPNAKNLTSIRVEYYEGPGLSPEIADIRDEQARQPLQASSQVFPEPIPADCDGDGDIDLADVDLFRVCASGPGVPIGDPQACSGRDLDGDADVDQADFGLLQRCLSGPDVFLNPNCMQ